METTAGRLTRDEVEKRLKHCEDPKVVDELCGFGQVLMKDALQNLHALDSKAVWFAGYGTAIITLLLSSFGAWSKIADSVALTISILAAMSAFAAALYAVKTIRLQTLDLVSEDEWLKNECLTKIEFLKRYRILTLWRAIDSTNEPHAYKTRQLKKSERWLYASVILLLAMLVEMAGGQIVYKVFGGWHALIAQRNLLGIQGWHNLLGSAGLGCGYLNLCSLSPGHFVGLADLIMRGLVFFSHVNSIFRFPR